CFVEREVPRFGALEEPVQRAHVPHQQSSHDQRSPSLRASRTSSSPDRAVRFPLRTHPTAWATFADRDDPRAWRSQEPANWFGPRSSGSRLMSFANGALHGHAKPTARPAQAARPDRRRGAMTCTRLLMLSAVVLPLTLGVAAHADAQAPSYLSQWGTQGSQPGQFDNPFGITTDGAGNVYVADLL